MTKATTTPGGDAREPRRDDAPLEDQHGDALFDGVAPDPTQADETTSDTGTDGGVREDRTSRGSDASGLAVDDEARGVTRQQRDAEGATEVSSLD